LVDKEGTDNVIIQGQSLVCRQNLVVVCEMYRLVSSNRTLSYWVTPKLEYEKNWLDFILSSAGEENLSVLCIVQLLNVVELIS
jgi:hypothetical protein